MPPATKTLSSCWICRLRHKKCDAALPTCRNCDALEIDCLYSAEKPEWMDNGGKQRDMADRVKVQVKRNAKERRGRRMIQKITREIEGSKSPPPPVTLTRSSADSDGTRTSTGSATAEPQVSSQDAIGPETAISSHTSSSGTRIDGPLCRPRNGTTQSFLGTIAQGPLVFQNEQDLRFVTTYTNYIFPLLHPLYHPTFFEGGRAWLLVFAMSSPESCQLIISMATYFVSVCPIYPGASHRMCAVHTWEEVQSQSELAVKGMQHRVEEASRRSVAENLGESMHLLGDILLLLKFETMTGSSQWKVHLDAATCLFEQILSSPELVDDAWRLPFDLRQLSSGLPLEVSLEDANKFAAFQTEFRFFTAMVVISDILSGTALEQPPRLRAHHERVLGNSNAPRLNLKYIVGCENWVFTTIAEIVEIDLWKKQTKRDGTFSLTDLIQRSANVFQVLDKGRAALDESSSDGICVSRGPDGMFSKFDLTTQPPYDPKAYAIVTRIWVDAARLYLLVVMSGWHPESSGIREIVSKNLEQFNSLPSPGWLLSLAWPFCVTSCLVTRAEESTVRRIYEATESAKSIGPISEAMKTAEKVWKQRGKIDTETWDMAACFKGTALLM
ncbi:hypothetical protein NM208_g2420 [Fusarium decemcellulare]|uniref:Uncharacterized protein n=1 Tax=Fusarium decemcellulare TaxID=57161 RepID=A0ACC1ST24_9HYPO|nr:hypothetical protein NM208_g2420 [Fusarium decemcellulare]